MGSQTPVSIRPYCGGRGAPRNYYRPQRQLSREEIDYYCSQGSQTPVSVRPYCGGGYRGAETYDDGDNYYQGRRLTPREIRYYCSMGSQTPLSVRHLCGRY